MALQRHTGERRYPLATVGPGLRRGDRYHAHSYRLPSPGNITTTRRTPPKPPQRHTGERRYPLDAVGPGFRRGDKYHAHSYRLPSPGSITTTTPNAPTVSTLSSAVVYEATPSRW